MERLLLILCLLFLSLRVQANSCCGQSPASFTVLSLEQRLSLNTSFSFIESQGRVFSSDDFYIWRGKSRQIQAIKLNVASSLASRHQVFVSSSMLQGRYSDIYGTGTSQHLSDTQVGYTFEVLPEYSFSYWKPVIYVSLLGNVPSGKSIYQEASLSEGTDVTGHNQWGVGLGLTVRKVYFPLTITLQAKSLQIFAHQFDEVRVSDFYDNSMALLLNYALNFQNMAVNVGLTQNQLTKRKIEPSQTISGEVRSTTTLFGLQKTFGENWSAGLTYSDQTLLGRPRNTLLNRTYSLNIGYNYF